MSAGSVAGERKGSPGALYRFAAVTLLQHLTRIVEQLEKLIVTGSLNTRDVLEPTRPNINQPKWEE